MKTSWTKGLKQDQADDMVRDFKASLSVRRRLSELLKDKQQQSLKDTRRKETYANPNWAYVQADGVGYERALSEVISLILEDSVE